MIIKFNRIYGIHIQDITWHHGDLFVVINPKAHKSTMAKLSPVIGLRSRLHVKQSSSCSGIAILLMESSSAFIFHVLPFPHDDFRRQSSREAYSYVFVHVISRHQGRQSRYKNENEYCPTAL